ncbi:MAG: hypothetical protein JSW04_08880 [Desulfobacterales bacterium]|nr:MAG: hypothetical protein JSW04_08880 [Desulfobacterales bacterium]
MGEIKSTLDLVMEKTKHLTLSDEEKAEQQLAEAKKKIYGLVRKYQDGLTSKTYLEKELAVLRKTHTFNVDDILQQTLMDGLELGNKNESLLELLRDICGVDVAHFERLFDDFLNQVEDAAGERAKTIKRNLAEKQSISGSAIVPNLEADHEWLAMLSQIKDRFHQILSREKAAL